MSSNQTYFLNTSKENLDLWKAYVDKQLNTHSDKLYSVVEEKAMAKSVEIKLKAQYKAIDEEFNTTAKAAHYKELNTAAYAIVKESIKHDNPIKAIPRLYENADAATQQKIHSAHFAYQHVLKLKSADDSADGASRDIADARAKHIIQGAKSGSFEHITTFVETFIEHCDTLKTVGMIMWPAVGPWVPMLPSPAVGHWRARV